MKPPIPKVKDLVLVGGGHSHAIVLRILAMRPVAGLRITLVSPASHTPYSGMLPGMVAGHYRFEEAHIDLVRLCQWAQVRFIAGEVVGLNPSQRRLSLRGRPDIEYDLLSLDVGSQPELDSVPGAATHAVPVKPVAQLWRRWEALCNRLEQRGSEQATRIAIVGGGAGSVELALAMAHRLPRRSVEIALYCGAPQILPGYNERARQAVVEAFSKKAVAVLTDARVARVDAGSLQLSNGQHAGFEELFWCTGATAAPWLAASGLAVDEQGFLQVSDTLQALSDNAVFAAGDIATQADHPRPKAGVYAVRQGPVLAHNLRAVLLDKPLRQHRPQRRFLSLLSLGHKSATADRGPLSTSGGWVWHWKDYIDRKFMARFVDLPSAMSRRHRGALVPTTAQPPCGGCGAKVGADMLLQTLQSLAKDFHEQLLHPTESDDVSAIPRADQAVIYQSIDALRPLVSDPWIMGRIVANHALSDLYASGMKPLSALALVVVEFASDDLLKRELEQLLAGALHEFQLVGCRLTGGHSMQGPELNLGFAVNGVPIAEDGRRLVKQTAQVGDRLVLTKALGTGVLFAGAMQLLADGRDIAKAIDSMLISNASAAELALTHKASACTDVTGFGLLTHLQEMLGDRLGAKLWAPRLPIMDGALPLLASGVRSTMHAANQTAAPAIDIAGAVEPALIDVLHDPQSSGGLLIAAPAQEAEQLLGALHAAGHSQSAIIAELVPRDSRQPITLSSQTPTAKP
ncbi:MAG: selenide, water dikinase SelD [Pseudomonadota bacterium]